MRTLIFILLIAMGTYAQMPLTNGAFVQWQTDAIDFVCFDIRGDTLIDSLVYPCFRSTVPEQLIRHMGYQPRIIICGEHKIGAKTSAKLVVAAGYPADSVFYASFDSLSGTRYPVSDTLPLAFLSPLTVLPQDLSAHELRALMISDHAVRLIDVRSTAEIEATGVIKGACNIPWSDPFMTSLDQFSTDEDIILNCYSGGRAGSARAYMISEGFDSTRVINFGGLSKYTDARVGPTSSTPSVRCNCSGIESDYIRSTSLQQLSFSLTPMLVHRNGSIQITGSRIQNGVGQIFTLTGTPLTPPLPHSIISVAGLTPGLYLFRLTLPLGETGIKKFIVY